MKLMFVLILIAVSNLSYSAWAMTFNEVTGGNASLLNELNMYNETLSSQQEDIMREGYSKMTIRLAEKGCSTLLSDDEPQFSLPLTKDADLPSTSMPSSAKLLADLFSLNVEPRKVAYWFLLHDYKTYKGIREDIFIAIQFQIKAKLYNSFVFAYLALEQEWPRSFIEFLYDHALNGDAIDQDSIHNLILATRKFNDPMVKEIFRLDDVNPLMDLSNIVTRQ